MNQRPRALRIICADDHTLIGEALFRVFSQAGHQVEHVPDGLAAWEKLSQDFGHFDVLITDHQMPKLNGLELVSLLRKGNYRGRIIIHSASLTETEAECYRALGVDSIVVKPTAAEELLGLVEAFNES